MIPLAAEIGIQHRGAVASISVCLAGAGAPGYFDAPTTLRDRGDGVQYWVPPVTVPGTAAVPVPE